MIIYVEKFTLNLLEFFFLTNMFFFQESSLIKNKFVISYFRLENEVYDEDGNSLTDWAFGTDEMAIRSSPYFLDDLYTLYYSPEKR